MDYNRLLIENESLSDTNEALRKRIAQLEADTIRLNVEVWALRQHSYHTEKTVEELQAEGHCIATVPKPKRPYFDGPEVSLNNYYDRIDSDGRFPIKPRGNGEGSVYINDLKPITRLARPFRGKQFNFDEV